MDSNIGRPIAAGSTSLRGGLTLTLIGEAQYIIFELRWMLMLAFILICADFWFGISVSKYLHKPIRRSRACRRTLNKLVDYLCYILVAAFLGMAIGQHIGVNPITVSTIALLMCYGFEIDSIYSHICELHGVKNGISIWKILIYIITLRFSGLKSILTKIESSTEDSTEEHTLNKEP